MKHLYNKDEVKTFGYKITLAEFKCRCDYERCHYTLIDGRLVFAWNQLRNEFAAPLRINSGFRCQWHNLDVGGIDDSRHTVGSALDISSKALPAEKKIRLLRIAKKYFPFVIEYPEFIHVDMRG